MEEQKIFTPNIKGEMDEIKRVSQYLTRNENFPVSVDEVIDALKDAEEVTLTDELWEVLENTESNEIEKGDFETVLFIASHYGKSNPYKLRMKIADDEYERPMIVKFGDRYHLVSGNTRLCTAASMGVNPKVFIGDLNGDNEFEGDTETINESVSDDIIKTFLDRMETPSVEKLKYLGLDVTKLEPSTMISYYGGVDETIEKIEEMLSKYVGKELEKICGGYELLFTYEGFYTDDENENNIDVFVRVKMSGKSEMTLIGVDGVTHWFSDMYGKATEWESENDYEDGLSDELMMEMEDCLTDYFNDILQDKIGFSVYRAEIIDMY